MRTLPLLLAFALAALPLSGCVENVRDLREKLAAADADEPLEPSATQVNATTNVTKIQRAPVARTSVFGPNGALAYQSSFIAENATKPVFVPPNSNVTLSASNSEALEPGATLAKYAWVVDGKPHEGRQITVGVGEPGLYAVLLLVTDSNGKTDDQTLNLAVAPEPFDVVVDLVSGPVAGANGEGLASDVEHEITNVIEDEAHLIVSAKFETHGGPACDSILTVEAPDGAKIGPQDSGSDETITFANAAPGAYKITVAGFACAAPTGVPLVLTLTYLKVVPGLNDNGHGGHAH